MRILKYQHLKSFWGSRKADSDQAQKALSIWFKLAKGADWENFGSLKQTFGSADAVGNCVVFDVGNNTFRLIARINYQTGKIFVLKIMDHPEYDKRRWIDACGCHKPPPPRPAQTPIKRPPKRSRRS